MIKIENIDTWGWEHTIRGMRKPMNSEARGDSWFDPDNPRRFEIGQNDMKLMQNLYKASLANNFAHRKFMRQIMVSMDITAPRYWWAEFDTYKVGTVANSQSTMHKIHSKEFTLDDFSYEHLDADSESMLLKLIHLLNSYRDKYNSTKSKDDWWQMIQLLPQSYNQTRTVTMNYEVVLTMITQRTGHKLDEWREFVEVLKGLNYLAEIVGEKEYIVS